MSRWINTFEVHPFNTSLKNLKDTVNAIDEKIISDQTVIDEVIRLKELLIYINKYIILINPKISMSNPQGNLNQVNNNFTQTYNEIRAYNSNKNIGHLHNANNNLDTALSNLKVFNISLPTFNHQSIYSMLSTYEKTLDESLSQIDLPSVILSSKQIKNLKKVLIDGDSETQSIEKEINISVNNIRIKSNELLEFYNNTLNDNDVENTTKELISKAKITVLEETKTIHEKYIEFSTKIDELDKFYVKVFGSEDEDGHRIGGLEKELELRIESLEKFKIEQEKTFELELSSKMKKVLDYEKEQQLNNKNLYEQIEHLLPGATSAGLSKAYQDMKETFREPIKNWNKVFIGSIFIMFISTFLSFLNIGVEEDGIYTLFSFVKIDGIESTINSMLFKLPLYAPLIWLAIFSSKRRSENQRLEQEYAHKEALSKSYVSYKMQIDELNQTDNELLKKLLDSSISTVSYNASESLDKKHDAGTPAQEAVKLFVDQVKKLNK